MIYYLTSPRTCVLADEFTGFEVVGGYFVVFRGYFVKRAGKRSILAGKRQKLAGNWACCKLAFRVKGFTYKLLILMICYLAILADRFTGS
jgi:hypothetical protein